MLVCNVCIYNVEIMVFLCLIRRDEICKDEPLLQAVNFFLFLILRNWQESPTNKENPHDVVKTPQSVEVQKDETGMDRLRTAFFKDQYGNQSKEFALITQLSSISAFSGFTIGGLIRSRNALVRFIESNTATKFESHLEAKQKLQRIMFLAFVDGGWRWGWRIGLFSFTFTSLVTSISVYRGKDSLIEYTIAGGATGGLFKMSLGLRGMVAGSVIGSALGTVAGSLSLLVLKISGFSMSDIRDFSKLLHDTRQNAIKQSLKKHELKTNTDLTDRGGGEKQFVEMTMNEEKE